MKAIVVTDQAAGTAGAKLMELPEPRAAINEVVVQIHASGFTGDELFGTQRVQRIHGQSAARRQVARERC